MQDVEGDDIASRKFDLIYKGQELSSGGQREHDADRMVEVMEEEGVETANFEFYIEALSFGTPPTAATDSDRPTRPEGRRPRQHQGSDHVPARPEPAGAPTGPTAGEPVHLANRVHLVNRSAACAESLS